MFSSSFFDRFNSDLIFKKAYRNYPMFSDSKKIISVKNRGVRKQRVSEKTCFCASKNNYFDEK